MQCRRQRSRYGLHTTGSEPAAARTSHALPVAYGGTTESGEGFHIALLCERRLARSNAKVGKSGSGTLIEQKLGDKRAICP